MRDKIIEWYKPLITGNNGDLYYNDNGNRIWLEGENEIEELDLKLFIEDALEKIDIDEIDLELFEEYFYNGKNSCELEKEYNIKANLINYKIKKVLKKIKDYFN